MLGALHVVLVGKNRRCHVICSRWNLQLYGLQVWRWTRKTNSKARGEKWVENRMKLAKCLFIRCSLVDVDVPLPTLNMAAYRQVKHAAQILLICHLQSYHEGKRPSRHRFICLADLKGPLCRMYCHLVVSMQIGRQLNAPPLHVYTRTSGAHSMQSKDFQNDVIICHCIK